MAAAPPPGAAAAAASAASAAAIPRYHALDALRASMMMLGLVFHTALNYLPFVPQNAGSTWPYQDERTSLAFAVLVAVLHTFRMPVFFVVAGFFAALLHESRGPRAFVRHRVARLGAPLVCAWPVLYAATIGSAPYAQAFTAAPGPHAPIAPGVDLLHLWFLYFLLGFCLVSAPAARALDRAPAAWRERALDVFERWAPRPAGALALAAVTTLLLLPMETWHFDTASTLRPAPHVVAAYGVFFVTGWLLFARRQVLARFRPPAWRYLGAGLLVHGLYLFLFDQGYADPLTPDKALLRHPLYDGLHEAGLTAAAAAGTHAAAMAALALSVWFLVYAILGLFLRYREQPSALWRYLSDASYWMYIIHLPLAFWVPVAFGGLPLPSGAKFVLSVAGVAALTLVSYHWLARATFIGGWLNGRRHPRVAPWRTGPAPESRGQR